MEKVGCIGTARAKVQQDVDRYLATLRDIAAVQPQTLPQGIALLRRLRSEAYEDLNQIQHEFAILCAAEWLAAKRSYTQDVIWSWNPRQTGTGDEPDLRGERDGQIVVSAEITTSTEPKGFIDQRMKSTLDKLSRMSGALFYFTCSDAMRRRARTKISRANWLIEVENIGIPQ